MRVPVYSRELVLSHFFQTKALAWQCSLCRRLFCRTLEETERDGGTNPPIYIEREFRIHTCQLDPVELQEQCEGQRIARSRIADWVTRHDRNGGER